MAQQVLNPAAAFKSLPPLVRTMTVVFSNGATVRMPTTVARPRPLFLARDAYNQILWEHKIKTEAMLAAEANYMPDLSKFYDKYMTPQKTPGKAGGSKS